MKNFIFMEYLLELIRREDFFKRIAGIYLQIVAVTILIASVLGFVLGWKDIFDMQAAEMLGGIFFQLFFVVAMYMVLHAFLIRSKEIKNLPEGESSAVSISAIYIRLFGEAYASLTGVMAIGGGIFIWFGGGGVRTSNALFKALSHYFPFSTLRGESFVQGLTFMVRGALYAFLFLLASYLLAELITAVANIARNTKASNK